MFPLTSFLLYTFVTSITPGPNNIMSMSLGLKVGFKKTLYFNAGVLTVISLKYANGLRNGANSDTHSVIS